MIHIPQLIKIPTRRGTQRSILFPAHARIQPTSICPQHGQIEVGCISSRFNAGQGKGLKLPVDHRLVGNAHYLRELITKLHRKQEKEGSDWKIRGLRKCDCQD